MQAWPFMPQVEYTEVLEWLTDVIQTKAGEQRLALRELPRQELQLSHFWTPAQYSQARALVAAYGHLETQVPLWGYLTRLGSQASGQTSFPADTDSSEYVAGGKAFVWQSEGRFEVLDVLSAEAGVVTFATPTVLSYDDAYMAPGRSFWMSQGLDGQRGSTDVVRASAYFRSTATVDLPAPDVGYYPTLAGYDVMTDRPVLLGTVRDRLARDVEWCDSSLGIMWADPVLNYMTDEGQAGWDMLTAADEWRLRRWLYARRGRQAGFWMPTWNADLTLSGAVTSSATSIVVASVGYTEPGYLDAYPTRGVRVRLTSGSTYFVTVNGAEVGPTSGTERLLLTANAGFSATPSQVESIDFLDFCRLDADRIEIKHRAARGSSVLVPIKRIPAP